MYGCGYDDTYLTICFTACCNSGEKYPDRNNYKWDKTKQYRVNLIKIRSDLNVLGYELQGYKFELKIPANPVKSEPKKFRFGHRKILVRTIKKLGAIK